VVLGVTASGTGAVIYGNEDGQLAGIGRPVATGVPVGRSAMAMLVSTQFLEMCRSALERGVTRVADVVNSAVERGLQLRYVDTGIDCVLDVDTTCTLLEAMRAVLDERGTLHHRSGIFVPEGDVFEVGSELELKDGPVIGPGTVLRGPTFIGPDCQIGAESTVGPYASIEAGATIGNGCHIRETMVLSHARVRPGAVLANTVVFGDQALGCESQVDK